MRNSIAIPVLLIAAVSCSSFGCSRAGEEGVTREGPIEYRKYPGAWRLKAGDCEAVVIPEAGARIAFWGRGGRCLSQVAPVEGKVLKPNEGWGPWDGAQQDMKVRKGDKVLSQLRPLFLHAYEGGADPDSPAAVKLVSGKCDALDAKETKRFSMAADGTLRIERRLDTQLEEPFGVTFWARSLFKSGGTVLMPLAPAGKSAYPSRWRTRENPDKEPQQSPGAEAVGDCLRVRDLPKDMKSAHVYTDSKEGWLAYVVGDEVQVARYPIEEKGTYPHEGGATGVVFYALDRTELEPFSAEQKASKGTPAAYWEEWTILKLEGKPDPATPEGVAAIAGTIRTFVAARKP